MKLKGSIAVFAVAAAFAGQASAYNQTCRDLIGAQGFAAEPSVPTGAWAIANANAWESGKLIDCVVPKNRKASYLFNEQIDPNLCSTYNALMSADQKYIGKTPTDAATVLTTYRLKLLEWLNAPKPKISSKTYEAMEGAALDAQKCIEGK